MSTHSAPSQKPVTATDIAQSKGVRRVTMLTAYDHSIATLVDQSGIDMILVGDSLGMVMLGRQDTVSVTLEEMIHHCRAVTQAPKRALVVGDLPFMSYESGVRDALHNAARLCREGGVRAVKLEGGRNVAPQVKAMVESGIPVCGHIGLTPQRSAVLGGFKVQGKSAQAGLQIIDDALALQEAGCFAVVLEAVPAPLAQRITERLDIPIIGIGGGPHCDGQVLVYHDMLGLYGDFMPKFGKRYAEIGEAIREAFRAYAKEVVEGTFPGPEHSFTIKDEDLKELDELLKQRK